MDYLTIDRFEGDMAVLEDSDGNASVVPRADLPAKAAEQDVLRLEGGRYRKDPEETARRREQNLERLRKLRERT